MVTCCGHFLCNNVPSHTMVHAKRRTGPLSGWGGCWSLDGADDHNAVPSGPLRMGPPNLSALLCQVDARLGVSQSLAIRSLFRVGCGGFTAATTRKPYS